MGLNRTRRRAAPGGSERIAELERELAKARATAGAERERGEDLKSELAERDRRLDRAISNLDKAGSAVYEERAARAAAEQALADERSRSAELEARVTDLEQRLDQALAEREEAPAPAAPVKDRAPRSEADAQVAGSCAVCQHPPDGDDLDKLREGGWIAHDGILLCPACQADGWRFPPDAAFPLRRYSDRTRRDEPAGNGSPGQPASRSALATAASDAPTPRRARAKPGPSPLRAARDRRR